MTFKIGDRNGTVTAAASGDKGEREAKLKAEKKEGKKRGNWKGGGGGEGGGGVHSSRGI